MGKYVVVLVYKIIWPNLVIIVGISPIVFSGQKI